MSADPLRLALAAATVAATLLPLTRRDAPLQPPQAFKVGPRASAVGREQTPLFAREFVDPHETAPSVHAAALCEVSGGRVLAAWYGGTREGAHDVAIYTATMDRGATSWSAPRAVVTRESAQRELDRYVGKVGNAVVFSDGSENIRLLYVAIAAGGWSASALNLKASADGGETWSASRRLHLSPFFNVSELVKNQPVPLQGGGWAVPIYHELLGKFSEVLWLAAADDERPVYSKTRVAGGATAFQPALVALGERQALVLGRDCGGSRCIWRSQSEDGGASWSPPADSGLANPDSGLDAIRLHDGRVLLAFNDSREDRANLRLAVSSDGGATWRRATTFLEAEPGAEFSYPFLLQEQAGEGLIHVVYTWRRKAIRHAAFNTAWLDAQFEEGRK